MAVRVRPPAAWASRGLRRRNGAQLARIAVAGAVSWQLCIWLGARQPPVYAVIVPLVALRDEPFSAFNVSLARLVGVVAGLATGIAVLHVLHPGAAAVALVLAVTLAIGWTLGAGGALNAQVAASGLLVFANADPDAYAARRLWETAVGVGVTLLLAPLLFPPNPYRALTRRVGELADRLAASLLVGGTLGQAPTTDAALQQATADAAMDEQAARALPGELAAAERSVRVNPLWYRHRTRLPAWRPIAEAAGPIAGWVRVFVDEFTDLIGRADFRASWPLVGPRLAEIVQPLATATRQALLGADAAPALDEAWSAFERHLDVDPSRLGAVSRRPLRRLATELARLSADNAGRRTAP